MPHYSDRIWLDDPTQTNNPNDVIYFKSNKDAFDSACEFMDTKEQELKIISCDCREGRADSRWPSDVSVAFSERERRQSCLIFYYNQQSRPGAFGRRLSVRILIV